MDSVVKASMVLTALIIGTSIAYGLIYLFNQLLYQIFVHPERTLGIIVGMWAIYGISYYVRKRYRA